MFSSRSWRDRKRFTGPLPGLKAILWLDKDAPSADQTREVAGLCPARRPADRPRLLGPGGSEAQKTGTPRLTTTCIMLGRGKSRCRYEGFQDPYQVALDAHLLVSRRNDLVRLYNPETTNCHCSLDPVHKKRLVQIVNYSPTPVTFVTLWVNNRARSARFWNPGAKDSLSIPGVPAAPGTEFGLPTIAVNCALEVEGSDS